MSKFDQFAISIDGVIITVMPASAFAETVDDTDLTDFSHPVADAEHVVLDDGEPFTATYTCNRGHEHTMTLTPSRIPVTDVLTNLLQDAQVAHVQVRTGRQVGGRASAVRGAARWLRGQRRHPRRGMSM